MKFAYSLTALAAAVSAAPASRSALKQIRAVAPKVTDADILNYALTLEHLEDTFYKMALDKFPAPLFSNLTNDFYSKLTTISSDEDTHVKFLTAALTKAGATPVAACTYDFGAAFDTIQSFIMTSSILEGVGVSAYLGAAAEIMSAEYLTAAGSILTTESRHSAYIRNELALSPFPTPFDVPLSLDEVYTLASPYITSCPSSNPTLPVKAFPMLVSPMSNGNITAGKTITLSTPNSIVKPAVSGSQIYAAFITVTGPIFAPATATDGGFTVTVPTAPDGSAPISGQTYVVLTGCNTTVSDDTVAAGPAVFEVGPL